MTSIPSIKILPLVGDVNPVIIEIVVLYGKKIKNDVSFNGKILTKNFFITLNFKRYFMS